MPDSIQTDLAVIGAGSAGLSVAAGAVQMGARVVLVERAAMGGDCLNVGCVPSKSLLAAAHAAATIRGAGRFGIDVHEPTIDFRKVHAHVHGVIASIAPHDSQERFESLGVRVIRASARFTGKDEIEAGGERIQAKRIVVATGSRPAVPPVPGLDTVPFLTNETIFDLTERPEHLLVLGGGPIGCELAQAFRRLGARATIIERYTILPKDDPDAVAVVRDRLLDEGIELHEQAEALRAERDQDGVALVLRKGNDSERRIVGSHLLLAAGRRPNVEDLELDTAGIETGKAGIIVDKRLRTTNHRVFAIGDVVGGPQLTHMASYHASIVIRNALFRMPAKIDDWAVPWVTFTDPELAQVGLTEAMARERGLDVRTVISPLEEVDRARAERATEGFAKVVADGRGRVLGATIVGRQAGELIQLWCLAIQEGIGLSKIAQMIAPYPTLGEINKRVAGSWFTPTLFSKRTHRLVRLLLRLP